jgi:hypothetical protein
MANCAPAGDAGQATVTTTRAEHIPGFPVTLMTLTATITPVGAVGTVQFKDGVRNLGNPVTISNGTASGFSSTLHGGRRDHLIIEHRDAITRDNRRTQGNNRWIVATRGPRPGGLRVGLTDRMLGELLVEALQTDNPAARQYAGQCREHRAVGPGRS